MPLSKKYYKELAKLVCKCNCPKPVKDDFVNYLGNDNPRFDEDKFREAIQRCEVKKT